MPKVEMIIEYTTDGTDYQYNDNHGVLIRCKDCKRYVKRLDNQYCDLFIGQRKDDDYCSKAEKRCEE